MGTKPTPAATRFWAKVHKSDGCWTWTAGTNEHGYGRIRVPGHPSMRAHRFAYEITHGPVPSGLVVMHTCDNPACVRPDHLRAGTKAENSADMKAKGRQRNQWKDNPRQVCGKGHALVGDNVQRWGGRLRCRECERARTREQMRRIRADAAQFRRGVTA